MNVLPAASSTRCGSTSLWYLQADTQQLEEALLRRPEGLPHITAGGLQEDQRLRCSAPRLRALSALLTPMDGIRLCNVRAQFMHEPPAGLPL
jgi:hypothetical protein